LKALTRILVALLALLALAVVGGIVFLANLDPNDYKDRLVAEVAKATGRELSIEGPLELGLWPKLRLKTGRFSLGNAEGFGEEPFLAAEELQVAVATLPLLTRRVEMDTVVVRGLALNLARDAAGRGNWEDLARGEEAGKEQADGGALAALVLGGVDVRDARIAWEDAQAGRSVVVERLNAATGPLDFGKPVEFRLDAGLKATKPTLDGETALAGTVAYELDAKHYTIAPFSWKTSLRGAGLPGGKADIEAAANVDLRLGEGTASIRELKFEGLGLALAGDVEVDHLTAPRPGGRGTLTLASKDLGVLLKALELPAAQRIASMKERGLDFRANFDANMDSGEVSVPELSGRLLGATLDAKLTATRANTDQPAVKANLSAGGADLPSLLVLASQFAGNNDKAARSLEKALAKTKDRSFSLAAELDADLAKGSVRVPTLAAKLLGNELSGQVESAGDGAQAFKGSLRATGPDLSALLATSAAFQGAEAKAIDNLVAVLASAKDRGFLVEADFDASPKDGRFAAPKLSATLLGNRIDGTLSATGTHTGKPAAKGELRASGPDLPALLAVAGGLQGGDSGLASLAKGLSGADTKSFSLETTFDADTGAGRIALPALKVAGLGLTVDGRFTGNGLDGASGNIDGRLAIAGDPRALLTGLDQAALAGSLRTLAVEAGFKGSMSQLTLSPLTARAEVKGPDQGKPVSVTLGVGSAQAALDKETLTVKDLALTGLGMNVKGSLDATQIKTAPAYSGQLNVAPFNLRQVLASLGQSLPPMADPKSLTNVGLDTVFKGGTNSLALSGLNVKLDETALKGEIRIASFEGPDAFFRINVDRLDADRYLAPKAAGGTRAVTPEAAAAGATQLPMDLLRGLALDGELSIGSLVMSGAKLANVKVRINGKGGKLEVNPATADLYQGRYSGVVGLDATGKEPKISINTNLAKVAVEPLLVDLTGKSDLSGIVNFEARLTGSGVDSKRLTNTLNGQATFAVQNGVFRGVDVPATLRAVEVMIESKAPAPLPKGGETQFQSLTGTLDVKNGAVFNKDLLLDGNGFKVTGDGMLANLNDMTIKYDAKIGVDAASAERGSSRYNLGDYTVPVRCRGEISGTSCLPDAGEIVKNVAKDAAKKKLQEKLEDAVGGKAGEALKKILKF
jgi:AsmA protein